MNEGNESKQENGPQNVDEAVKAFAEHNDLDSALVFLRANPLEVQNFCYLIGHSYGPKDLDTPFYKLGEVIEKLLEK